MGAIVLILCYLASQVVSQTPPVMTFNEGGPIQLLALGDKSGYGCSFEAEDTEKDLTCCYIHVERENNRGKRLCSAPSQPSGCRQPGSGEYKVEELDGPVGWCKLTIFEARLNDAGVYKINFPFDPARYNQETTVTVKQVTVKQIGLNQAESLWMVVAMVLLVVLLVLLAANGVIFFLQNKIKKNLENIPPCSLTSSKSAGYEEAGVEVLRASDFTERSREVASRGPGLLKTQKCSVPKRRKLIQGWGEPLEVEGRLNYSISL